MRIKLISILALTIAAFCTTGCDKGRSQVGPREANMLGIAKIQKENYTPAGVNTFPVETDELYSRRNFSGDKVTLFWGLVTIMDY